MSFLKIERVTSLPGTLVGSTMYIVKASDAAQAEVVFTNTDGTESRHVINKADIQSMINASVTDFSNIHVYADIAARTAAGAPTRNILSLVLDATADATVASGAAMYVYDKGTTVWSKVSEFESMDVVLTWSAIQGRPSSAVVDIDDAVNKRHAHANAAQLALINEDAQGNLLYNSKAPLTPLAVAEW